ncbi:MAG: hypothetical protein ABSE82_05920 [Nitrososphaerales archaeon]|jgi:hypothetical protein
MVMKVWYGRVSGHSNTYTIMGTFDSSEKAERAGNVLREALQNERIWKEIHIDWEPSNDASVQIEGNDLKFSVYTAGYLEEVYAIIKNQKPKEMREFEDAQELQVAFEFDSPEVELDEVKVLLLLKHPDLKELIEQSEAIVEHTGEGKTLCTFEYFGDWIYDSSESKLLGYSQDEIGCTVSVISE